MESRMNKQQPKDDLSIKYKYAVTLSIKSSIRAQNKMDKWTARQDEIYRQWSSF